MAMRLLVGWLAFGTGPGGGLWVRSGGDARTGDFLHQADDLVVDLLSTVSTDGFYAREPSRQKNRDRFRRLAGVHLAPPNDSTVDSWRTLMAGTGTNPHGRLPTTNHPNPFLEDCYYYESIHHSSHPPTHTHTPTKGNPLPRAIWCTGEAPRTIVGRRGRSLPERLTTIGLLAE